MDKIALTHTGWAWKVQNLIFCDFWELKNSSHIQTNKQTNNNDLLEKDGGTKNCIYKD